MGVCRGVGVLLAAVLFFGLLASLVAARPPSCFVDADCVGYPDEVCSDMFLCVNHCGNGVCDYGETSGTCAEDCGLPTVPHGTISASTSTCSCNTGMTNGCGETCSQSCSIPTSECTSSVEFVTVGLDDEGSVSWGGDSWSYAGCSCNCASATGSGCAQNHYPFKTVTFTHGSPVGVTVSAWNDCKTGSWNVWGEIGAVFRIETINCDSGYHCSAGACVENAPPACGASTPCDATYVVDGVTKYCRWLSWAPGNGWGWVTPEQVAPYCSNDKICLYEAKCNYKPLHCRFNEWGLPTTAAWQYDDQLNTNDDDFNCGSMCNSCGSSFPYSACNGGSCFPNCAAMTCNSGTGCGTTCKWSLGGADQYCVKTEANPSYHWDTFNTQSDKYNCGSCGNKCAAGETCINGACFLGCSGKPCDAATSCADRCQDTPGGTQKLCRYMNYLGSYQWITIASVTPYCDNDADICAFWGICAGGYFDCRRDDANSGILGWYNRPGNWNGNDDFNCGGCGNKCNSASPYNECNAGKCCGKTNTGTCISDGDCCISTDWCSAGHCCADGYEWKASLGLCKHIDPCAPPGDVDSVRCGALPNFCCANWIVSGRNGAKVAGCDAVTPIP